MPTPQPEPPYRSTARQGAVAVIRRDESLLVIRRSALVRAPGAYCFPGGGIEAGETPQQAVRRELREELGVDVTPRRSLWQCTTSWNVQLNWWLAELPEESRIQPNPDEVASYHWLHPEAIRQLPQLLESNHWFLDAWQQGEFQL